jgi:hypothetical protein
MAERILGPQGSKRRTRFLWVPMVALAALALFVIGNAQAVHDLGFQLDGDVSNACPAALTTCTSSQKDWADMFTVTDDAQAATETVTNSSAVTGAFTNATFTRDFESGSSCALNSLSTTFCTGDDTTFATGSKDTLDITGWECNHDNNVNSKIDIMNAYAAAYTDPATGDKLMYFGLEKNKDNGTNDVGFWFLQGNASCTAPSGHKPWTGTHTVNDVLVVSEFTNGGGVSNITAYKWVGGANPLVQIATAGDCKGAAGNDNMCATTNSGATPFNTTITTPWLTADATGGVGNNKIVPPDFFEGGINLTRAFSASGSTAPSCFNTFIADTRSSNVTSSTLFDFARGQIGQCTASLTTAAGSTANGGAASPTSIGTGVVSSGTDTATLTITGTANWAGTMTWYLCGPVTTDGCSSSGTGAGYLVTTRSVNQGSAASQFVSGSVNLTSAGRYCWTAHFEPDTATKNAGIDPKDDNGANECFTVAAVQGALATAATCSASPCIVGSTLSDTATLSNAASAPGTNGTNTTYPSIGATNGAAAPGSISWIAYGPDDCSTVAMASTSRTVSGNGTYPTAAQTAVSFTANTVGQYTFVAQFTSTSVNTLGTSASPCPDTTDTEEVTVVGTASSSSAQRWLPNDRIVLSTNGSTLHGTLTVTLYRGSFTGTAANCAPAATASAISGQAYTFTPNGDASGTAYQTSNTDPASANHTTFYVGTKPDGTAGGAAGQYFWLIHYVDTNLTDPTDRCETTTLTITD